MLGRESLEKREDRDALGPGCPRRREVLLAEGSGEGGQHPSITLSGPDREFPWGVGGSSSQWHPMSFQLFGSLQTPDWWSSHGTWGSGLETYRDRTLWGMEGILERGSDPVFVF